MLVYEQVITTNLIIQRNILIHLLCLNFDALNVAEVCNFLAKIGNFGCVICVVVRFNLLEFINWKVQKCVKPHK